MKFEESNQGYIEFSMSMVHLSGDDVDRPLHIQMWSLVDRPLLEKI